MGLYDLWKYRAYFRISNRVAIAGYQHRLTVPWLRGMRHDFRDIRFTTATGRKCSYWIESYTSKTSATVWIKVPDASTPGLILYYGNGQAVSESSGTNVFEFFDDFDTASLDTTKWNSPGGGTTSQTGGVLSFTLTAGLGEHSIVSKAAVSGDGYAIRSKCRYINAITNNNGGISIRCNTDSKNQGIYLETGSYIKLIETSVTAGTTIASGISQSTWYVLETTAIGNTMYGRYNDGSWGSWSRTALSGSFGLHANNTSSITHTTEYMWVLIRKYAATEPTLSLVWHGVNPAYFLRLAAGVLFSTPATGGTDYSWDPVNVNLGLSFSAWGVDIECAPVNADLGLVVAAGGIDIECAPVNVYLNMQAAASWEKTLVNPTADDGTLIDVTVTWGMDDAVTEAEFSYDGTEVGCLDDDYMKQIILKIPDRFGTEYLRFVGIAPGGKGTFKPHDQKFHLTAYDYGLYLIKGDPPDDADLSILPINSQTVDTTSGKVLSWKGLEKSFQIGMRIVGGTSGAYGKIVEINWQTSTLTLYPASTAVFVDSEELLYGGVRYAYADGHSVNIPYTTVYGGKVYPEDWIISLLGGSDYLRKTGIVPENIVATDRTYAAMADSDGAFCFDVDPVTEDHIPAVPFDFPSKQSRHDDIKEFSKYMRRIWLINPKVSGNAYYSAAQWFRQSQIDDPLYGPGLPSPAAFTPDSGDIDAEIGIGVERNGDNTVDKVDLSCQDYSGNWLHAVEMNARARAGEGPCRTYFDDELPNIAVQTDLNNLCADLFAIYSEQGKTYTMTFIQRPDIERFQILQFSGFGTTIPDGNYRVIWIQYHYGCAINTTSVKIISTAAFDARLRLGWTYTDSITEAMRIYKYMQQKEPKPEIVTVLSVGDNTLNVKSERGVETITRKL